MKTKLKTKCKIIPITSLKDKNEKRIIELVIKTTKSFGNE
jgi:hypothetical protein